MIPKIIHHTAPTDTSKWHPLWKRCLDSWKINFPEPEYTHILWNDEQIDNLVRNNFSHYWDLYNSFELHIIKIDFVRFCMLSKFGGIYADMDMFCYKNFYDELNEDLVLLESRLWDTNEVVQNALIASSKKNSFIHHCIEECRRNFYPYNPGLSIDFYVKDICGPVFLTRTFLKFGQDIKILPKEIYNPEPKDYNSSLITKHMLSGLWGKDAIEQILKDKGSSDYETFIKNTYEDVRKLDIDNIDFYKTMIESN